MPSSYEAYFISLGNSWGDLYTFSLPPATYTAKYVYSYTVDAESVNQVVYTGNVTILNDNSFTLRDTNGNLVTDPEVGMYIIVSSRTYDFDDAVLSTLYNFGNDDRFNFNGDTIGPNLVVPFSGGYLIENGINATTPSFLTTGGAVSFPFGATGATSGFPITLDLIDPRYCYFLNSVGAPGICLYRLDRNLTVVKIGYFPPDQYFGIYSITHDPINDRILLATSYDRNFWENLSPVYNFKIGTFSLAPFRSAVPLPVSLSFNYLVIGPGLQGKGRWAIDNDNFGNLFMALSSGEIYKINTNVSPTVNTCIAKGFIEPWSVFVINKNSLNPHILVANTRGGSVDIIYPNGNVSTVIGQTNLLWSDTVTPGLQKTIADGDIATAKFGCPTRLTLLPDNSFLIGDETGLAIRRLASPKLASLISSLYINPDYLLNIPPGSILNSIGFSANQYNITTSMIGSPVSQPFFNVVPNNIDYFSIYIENVGVPEEPYHITYKIPADGYFWTKNKKHMQSVKNQNISSLRYLNIQILDSQGNLLTGPDWSFSLKLIKGGIVE